MNTEKRSKRFDDSQERVFPIPSSTDWDSTIEKVSKEKPRANPFIKFLRKPVVRNTAIAIPLIGLAIFGGKQFIDQNNEKIHKAETSSTFDPNATDLYINPNNSIFMTLEEYGKPGILWSEGNISTVALFIKFKDNRTPTFHLEKTTSVGHPGLNQYNIDEGLIEGDTFVSPIDGELHVLALDTSYNKYVYGFYVNRPGDEPKTMDSVYITCRTQIKPLVDLSQVTRADQAYLSPIKVKANQPIFEILSSLDGKSFEPDISIIAAGGHIAYTDARDISLTLDLAASEDKVILLK
jgi:hypothetical protein